MVRRYSGTNFVTGLRAYAAMGVVLIHCGGGGLRSLGDFGNELADLGATGVYVFFVISGFSVAASYAQLGSCRDFLVRRIMRLAPVYYAFLLIAVMLMQASLIRPNYWATTFDVPLDAYNLLMHVLFLGFLDYRINNSIIGVEWSLSVEMFWYLLIPLLLVFIDSRMRGLTWAVPAAVVVYFANKLIVEGTMGQASQYVIQWSPVTYAPAFVLGISAYRLRRQGRHLQGARSDQCIGFVIGLLLLQCTISLMEIRLLIPLLTYLLLMAGSDERRLSQVLFNNRLAVFLGTISYSIYLWHHLVIEGLRASGVVASLGQGLWMFLAVSLLTVPLSLLTFHFVEMPANRLGRVLTRRQACPDPVLARAV